MTVTYPMTISTTSVAVNPNGGTPVTIAGVGFPANVSSATLTVGGVTVTPIASSSSTTKIVFTVPSGSASSTKTGTVAYNGATASFTVNYAAAAIAVSSVSPTTGGFSERTTLTVGGSGFGTSAADVVVTLKLANNRDAPCAVRTVSSTSLTCDVDGGAPGVYNVEVAVGTGTGASPPGVAARSNAFEMFFRVTGLSPATVGAHLAATLTITGVGFPPNGSPAPEVSLSGEPCAVATYDVTRVTCQMSPRHPVPAPTGPVSVRVISKQYTAACASDAACAADIVEASTSNVSSASSSAASSSLLPGATATVSGVGLSASAGAKVVLLTPAAAEKITASSLGADAKTCGSLVDVNGDGTSISCQIPSDTTAGCYTMVHVHPTLGLSAGRVVHSLCPRQSHFFFSSHDRCTRRALLVQYTQSDGDDERLESLKNKQNSLMVDEVSRFGAFFVFVFFWGGRGLLVHKENSGDAVFACYVCPCDMAASTSPSAPTSRRSLPTTSAAPARASP